ncbi:hypothetical protein [Ignatzschineria sp. LJL83]
MSTVEILKFKSKDLSNEKIDELAENRNSFVITDVSNMAHTVKHVENLIERKGYKVRVYTENRAAGIAVAAIPTGITQVTGIATAIGIGVHNLVTINPDYELGKNLFNNSLTVMYKK